MLDTRPETNPLHSEVTPKMLLPSFRKLNELLFTARQEPVLPFKANLKPKVQLLCRTDTNRLTKIQYYTKLPSAPERIGRIRRRPDQMQRFYGCRQNGCVKAYESISHLNTHIRRKSHGKPLTKSDFPEIYDQPSSQ